MERVIAYIDGFNLYFGLRSRGYRQYYWLDVQKLVDNLLRANQSLMFTKYFTSRIAQPAGKRKRQSDFIEALQTLDDLGVYYGQYQLEPKRCGQCGRTNHIPHEKMTDVNIAVELLADGFQDKFDTALLISADSDLTAPVKAVRRLFPHKRVVVAFPPDRSSKELKKVATAHLVIGRATLANSLLPLQVKKPDGFVLHCPPSWR